jgi:hypothetical protein
MPAQLHTHAYTIGMNVLLIEANEKVVGVWDFLIRATTDEILSLPLIGPEQTVDDLGAVPQEARWLVGFWLNKGTAQPCKKPSAWMRGMVRPNQFWGEAIRHRIARQVQWIRHWRVRCDTYSSAPDALATWFVDPPYAGRAGSFYPHGSKSTDYSALAAWRRERQGQVIVCENEGAEWLPFVPFHAAKANHGGARKGVSHEAIWTQGSHALQTSLF